MNPTDPRHGTRAGYLAGCAEPCCTKAHTRYIQRYLIARAARGGRRLLLPVTEVQTHLDSLAAQGMSVAGIAAAAHLPPSTIGNILIRRTVKHVRPDTARAILAVQPTPRPVSGTPYVYRVIAEPYARRLRALGVMGWSIRHVAATTGLSYRGLCDIVAGGTVQIETTTADKLLDVYRRLSTATPVATNEREARSITFVRNHAAARGWPGPLDWDDIDDLGEHPTARDDAQTRAPADLDEFMHLVRGGESVDRAAARLGVTVSAIEQAARRNNRPDITELTAAERHHQRRAAA